MAATKRRSDDADLLDLIGLMYESVLEGDARKEVTRRLAARHDSHAVLYSAFELEAGGEAFNDNHGLDEELYGLWLQRYTSPQANPLVRAGLRHHAGEVLLSDEICPEAELVASEAYQVIMGPADLHRSMGGFLVRDRGLAANLTVYRSRSAAPYEADDVERFRPLMRHFRIATKLRLHLHRVEAERRAALDVLDRLDLGVVLLDRAGVQVFVNRRAREALERNDGLTLKRGRLRASLGAEQAELDRLVDDAARAGQGRGAGAGGNVLVTRPSGSRPFSLLVAPVGSTLRRHDAAAVAMAVFDDPDGEPAIPAEALARLYGLTAAEAAIAIAIAGGWELDEIAQARGVSVNIVRSQLYRVMAKTDTRRQAELARLLHRGAFAILRRA